MAAMTRIFSTLARGTITTILLFGVAGKLSGWSAEYFLPQSAHYAVAIGECLLAIALWTTWRRPAAVAVLLLAAGGIFLAVFVRPANCGCFGRWWTLSWIHHLWLSAILGAFTSVLSILEPRAETEEAANRHVQANSEGTSSRTA
jgi:hypothetical protein